MVTQVVQPLLQMFLTLMVETVEIKDSQELFLDLVEIQERVETPLQCRYQVILDL